MVGLISRHHKDRLGPHPCHRPRRPMPHLHLARPNRHHLALEMRRNRPLRNSVVDVRTHPVLDRLAQRRAPMHQRHLRPPAIQIERRVTGRVLSPNHHNPLPIVGSRFRVVMRHMRQVFTRHAQEIGPVVVAHGQRHRTTRTGPRHTSRIHRRHHQHGFLVMPVRLDRDDALTQHHRDLRQFGGPAIVAPRLEARRLVVRRRERQSANLQQRRRREERHVRRKPADAVGHRALVDHQRIHAVLPRRDGRGQPRRAGPDNQQVTHRHGVRAPRRPS